MSAVLLQISLPRGGGGGVPLSRRLGLGSVLGYVVAGIVIGPVLGLVGREAESVLAYVEFWVVMMLFLIGLEMRRVSRDSGCSSR